MTNYLLDLLKTLKQIRSDIKDELSNPSAPYPREFHEENLLICESAIRESKALLKELSKTL